MGLMGIIIVGVGVVVVMGPPMKRFLGGSGGGNGLSVKANSPKSLSMLLRGRGGLGGGPGSSCNESELQSVLGISSNRLPSDDLEARFGLGQGPFKLNQ